jgi:hypothetical protein
VSNLQIADAGNLLWLASLIGCAFASASSVNALYCRRHSSGIGCSVVGGALGN